MIAPAPTIAAGTRCQIHIAATLKHIDGEREYTVNYLGCEFTVTRQEVVQVRGSIVVVEIVGHVIESTGIASYLVDHQGHALRVPAQHIRCFRFFEGDRCQNHNSTRFGTVTRDCLEHSTVHVRWDDGEERQENPECVDAVPVPASAEKRVVQPVLAGKNAWDEYKKAGVRR